MFLEFTYFGAVLSLFAFWIGGLVQKKWKVALANPLLISIIICIVVLKVTGVEYSTFQKGAKMLSWFLTPVTVCLAVPLYKQFLVLKKNLPAVGIGIVLGCAVNMIVILAIMLIAGADRVLTISLLPKSITTAIALGVCAEAGGIEAVTIIGIMVAGLFGGVFGPEILKLFRVTEPVAQGLAMGTASHAIGTSRAAELGEVQQAMSSLAIVVNGLLTAVVTPMIISML